MLSPGDRVWVEIPGTGYVGVGVVKEAVQSVSDFTVVTPDGERAALEVLQHRDKYQLAADAPRSGQPGALAR